MQFTQIIEKSKLNKFNNKLNLKAVTFFLRLYSLLCALSLWLPNPKSPLKPSDSSMSERTMVDMLSSKFKNVFQSSKR